MESQALTKPGAVLVINGDVISSTSKFARGAAAVAFQMMGGVDALQAWAEEHETEFYTKIFTKLIGRESEATGGSRVEDMLLVLDGETEEVVDVKFDDGPVSEVSEQAQSFEINNASDRARRRILVDAAEAFSSSEPY